jgi:hypothetical protein
MDGGWCVADVKALIARVEEADRMLKKGELQEARAAYAMLLPAAPPEIAAALRNRIQRVDELSVPGERAAPRVIQQSTQAMAEAAANEGRYDVAVKLYASLVATRPDDQLARERLFELNALVARAVVSPNTGLRTSQGPAPLARPTVARTVGLPGDPVAMLQELLARIRVNRRAGKRAS